MRFENTEVWGFEHALRGMRNPKNSWDKSDSDWEFVEDPALINPNDMVKFVIGENDVRLAQTLIRAGSEHRKFLRQVFVSVDITAPLYWWKEFDTYKVGTTSNSTSTMHKLAQTPITQDCFEMDAVTEYSSEYPDMTVAEALTNLCENYRKEYLRTKDERVWRALIQILPESWLQTRTITMNYENIYSMVRQRKNHKLNEWSGKDDSTKPNFIAWARSLPYAEEFIFIDEGATE